MLEKTLFTGMIDEFYQYKLGTLQYRTVRFETEELEMEKLSGKAVVNYIQTVRFLIPVSSSTNILSLANSRQPSFPESILLNGNRVSSRITRSMMRRTMSFLKNTGNWQTRRRT